MLSYLATGRALWRTLAISVRTVTESQRGRLSVARGDDLIQKWAHELVERAGVTLEIRGRQHVQFDRAFVVMSNHQSHFDIPVIYAAFPGSLRMVGKAELFRIPIWGRALREAGFVPVTRSGDRAEAAQAMGQAAEAIRQGISIWIAPEGTRSLDGKIGAFKRGGFRLAREVGVPILPLSIDGSIAVLPKHTNVLRCGHPVRVTFGQPIAPEGRTQDSLMEEVRAFFLANVRARGEITRSSSRPIHLG